jgi:arginyl-tRNA synthetase
MDRVLRRRDGRLTYIASDVAYHENKLNRPESATKLITILGPDHHGYIGRLTAVMAALLRGSEDTPEANAEALRRAKETLEVVIYQLVRFLKDGKPAPMRKRDGNIYELRDLIDELGKNLVPDGTPDEQRTTGRDVARFFYLMRSHDTTMDFDIDLATQQSDENPVFYAQYAHARICSVLSKATSLSHPGAAKDWGMGEGTVNTSLLIHPRELALIKKILDLPWEVERVAKDYGVHRLTTYAVELARTYHHFYDACRVIQPDQIELTWARLALCQATKTALHATFELLGVSSPERLERREAAA